MKYTARGEWGGWAVVVGVIITFGLVCFVLVELGLLLVSLRRSIPPLESSVETTLTSIQSASTGVQAIELNTTRTEAEMAGLLNTTRHIALEEQKNAQQQLIELRQVLDQTKVAVGQVGDAAKAIGAIAPVVNTSISQVTADAHNTLAASQELLQAGTDDLHNLDIARTVGFMADAAKNTDQATANISATTEDIRGYVHRETTPIRGFWNSVKAIINLTWSVRGALGL